MSMKRFGIATLAALAVLVVVIGGTVWFSSVHQTPLSRHLPAELRPRAFPAVDTAGLSQDRTRIIDSLRHEYTQNRPGPYYSEGVTEPWCADFVSTVLRDSGVPLRNPNSGSWRIPGVYTLTEYFQKNGALRPAQDTPIPGDVVLYEPPSALGQHTNIVVAVSGDTVTTVGGNQAGGISVLTYDKSTEKGIVGYGIPTSAAPRG